MFKSITIYCLVRPSQLNKKPFSESDDIGNIVGDGTGVAVGEGIAVGKTAGIIVDFSIVAVAGADDTIGLSIGSRRFAV